MIKLLISLFIFSISAVAQSRANYLPIKSDPLFELDIERLATVAKMPYLIKPYHIDSIKSYLEIAESSYPELASRIKQQLAKYEKKANLTDVNFEISFSNDQITDKTLYNARGQTTASNSKFEIAGYWNLSESINLNLGGFIYDGSQSWIPNNTYLSYSTNYFQLDVGYKELWLSPFQESAMVLSTQAEPIGRVVISNPIPITDWKIKYHLSYGKLSKMQGIEYEGQLYEGRPGFLTMHLSGQPLDWWTLGASRTLQFGGGPRKINGGDVWKGIIDPVSGDNCGGDSTLQNCSDELGNQQASLVNKFDFNWMEMPVSFYFEVAGEDTNDYKNYKLGNKTYNFGLFMPYLSDISSLLVEYQHIENGWYVHGLYQEGYRNKLHSLGHWWGDEKLLNAGIGAYVLTIRYNREINSNLHFDARFATMENDNLSEEGVYNKSIYNQGYELTLGLNQVDGDQEIRYQLYTGKDMLGEDFTRLSVEISF